jgi:hypothetical protein
VAVEKETGASAIPNVDGGHNPLIRLSYRKKWLPPSDSFPTLQEQSVSKGECKTTKGAYDRSQSPDNNRNSILFPSRSLHNGLSVVFTANAPG